MPHVSHSIPINFFFLSLPIIVFLTSNAHVFIIYSLVELSQFHVT